MIKFVEASPSGPVYMHCGEMLPSPPAGLDVVKLEGNNLEVIKTLIESSIGVMGHLGLLPQTAKTYKVQCKEKDSADRLLEDAIKLDRLGVCAIVLECIPAGLAKKVTETIKTKTIGIGAGPFCGGQVLVINDILGYSDFKPKFVKRYADVKTVVKKAVSSFKREVEEGVFPGKEEWYE